MTMVSQCLGCGLQFDVGVTPVGTEQCKISLYESEDGDRGILSLSLIEKDESFVRLPMKLVLADHPDDEQTNNLVYEGAPYNVRLACKLLKEKSLGEESCWFPYVQTLPQHVFCPLMDFQDTDVESLEYPESMEQFESYCGMIKDSWNKLDSQAHGNSTLEDYIWAISVVHSRSFGTGGRTGPLGIHMLVPLVDMFNHGGDRSRGLFQNPADKLDSAEWFMINPEQSGTGSWEMDLKATSRIEPQSPVLMSYGERSNDDFFLYYGFIPPLNPKDDYVLFSSLQEALDWYCDEFLAEEDPEIAQGWKEEAKGKGEAQAESLPEDGGASVVREHQKIRLMAGSFVDGRLLAAFEHLGQLKGVSTNEVLKHRCRQLLDSYSTSLLSDLSTLAKSLPDSDHDFPLLFAVYSKVIKDYWTAQGKGDSGEIPKEDEIVEYSWSQILIKTYLSYKKIILWDVILDRYKTS